MTQPAMIWRAAKVLWSRKHNWTGEPPPLEDGISPTGATHTEREECLSDARATLLAALDPQDEALIEAVARRLCDAWHSDVPNAKADDVVLDLSTHPAGNCYRWHGYIEQAVVAIGAMKTQAEHDVQKAQSND